MLNLSISLWSLIEFYSLLRVFIVLGLQKWVFLHLDAMVEKILTIYWLKRRGWYLGNWCCLCPGESTSHLLIRCGKGRRLYHLSFFLLSFHGYFLGLSKKVLLEWNVALQIRSIRKLRYNSINLVLKHLTRAIVELLKAWSIWFCC